MSTAVAKFLVGKLQDRLYFESQPSTLKFPNREILENRMMQIMDRRGPIRRQDQEASAADSSGPGQFLRGIRKKLGLTLVQSSKLTGISVSTLSKLETGKMSLGYENLIRLSDGLGFDCRQVYTGHRPNDAPTADVAPTGRRSITRSGDGPEIHTDSYRYIFPAGDLDNPEMKPMFIDVGVRSIEDFGDLIRHSGAEFTVVLEGRCEFHNEFYKPVILEKGDSVYFDASAGHAYIAVGEERCQLLCISTAEDSDLEAVMTPLANSILPDRTLIK